jgi:Bacterial Ig-like domain
MRFLALALTFSVAACTDNNTNNLAPMPDLSVGDQSVGMDGPVGVDSAVPDLTPLTPSQMIQEVRNAADGVVGNAPDGGQPIMALPVEDAYVTYLKPNVPGQTFDSAGFFVQADPAGPALFVNIDPTTLSPSPKVGDLLSFTVTAVSKNAGVRQANAIMGLAVSSSNNPLDTFVQDLTAKTDLVTALDSYESELSKLDATITGPFTGAGAGYLGATITTTGVAASTNNLKLRVPPALRDSKDLTNGCVVHVGNTPMWRFNAAAEPSAWLDAEVTVTSCPAPQVTSAHALDATTVVITFDRFIDVSSVTAGAFTFDNGLTVIGITLTAPNQVTITTSAQTPGTVYTVTVDATVKDTRGTAVDQTHNTAKFHGFALPATLQITEFTPGITGGFDLLELKAVTGGSVTGFTLQQDLVVGAKVLATLPDQVVGINDFIVLHIAPSPSPSPSNEFATKTDCTAPSCFATAWDANGVADIGNSARVLTIKDAQGNIQDGVAFFRNAADADAAFLAEMTALRDAGQWVCAVATCASTDATRSNNTQNTAAGRSLKRTGVADTNNVADWPSTGLTNSTYGQ